MEPSPGYSLRLLPPPNHRSVSPPPFLPPSPDHDESVSPPPLPPLTDYKRMMLIKEASERLAAHRPAGDPGDIEDARLIKKLWSPFDSYPHMDLKPYRSPCGAGLVDGHVGFEGHGGVHDLCWVRSSSQINKMGWESLDLRIKTWVKTVKISTSTLFTGERILCDQVFGSSETIRESCFADIFRDGALLLFSFPELVSGKSKKSPPPEKMFRAMDMYTVISENWARVAWDGACDGIERLDFVWRRRIDGEFKFLLVWLLWWCQWACLFLHFCLGLSWVCVVLRLTLAVGGCCGLEAKFWGNELLGPRSRVNG
ncbi:hypothetical protein Tsubulata_030470 [Turnera subulata]|uniref:Exocyst subunit Exo70 family protein n=1 Tax=Turnera subulata TaxID=218843 RepID=A0A9Q0FXG0_9ROSI|nr:hypothetical protein Tsubulata_030470 [Turnera subulata]